MSYQKIVDLFKELREYGILSIAIGGGEPLLHPDIERIVTTARQLGFRTAITTNGTILKDGVVPHRVHISYDRIHPTWGNRALIHKAIAHYRSQGCKVGLNHILTDLGDLDHIQEFGVDNIVLLREKPIDSFRKWDDIPNRHTYWLDACIDGIPCDQGVLSFHLDANLRASICSNHPAKIPYTTLPDTWKQLQGINCELQKSRIKEYWEGGNRIAECELCGEVMKNYVPIKLGENPSGKPQELNQTQMRDDLLAVCRNICNYRCDRRSDFHGYTRSDEEMEKICDGCEIRAVTKRWELKTREREYLDEDENIEFF